MNDNLNNVFNALCSYFTGQTVPGVNLAGTIYTATRGNYSVILGRDTLRLVVTDSDKNAIIAFNPTKVSVGSFERGIELNISIHESKLNESYSRLYIDCGELFQLSTLHDFDFVIVKEIYTKYLELLKVMKESTRVNGEKLLIDDAIQNISDTVDLYNKEA